MPQIIYTGSFIDDFDRIYDFLNQKNSSAAQKLAKLLEEKLDILATIPKAFSFLEKYRLYHLEFGAFDYTILYDYDEENNLILLLKIKHYREAGFKISQNNI